MHPKILAVNIDLLVESRSKNRVGIVTYLKRNKKKRTKITRLEFVIVFETINSAPVNHRTVSCKDKQVYSLQEKKKSGSNRTTPLFSGRVTHKTRFPRSRTTPGGQREGLTVDLS